MKLSHTLLICTFLVLTGCQESEIAEQTTPAPPTASNSGAATPDPAPVVNRDPRLEFNKLVQFLGTKNPRVYWLNTGIEGRLDPKNVKQDGNYGWRKPSRNGVSYQSIDMRITNHHFDGVQKIGTIIWTVTSDLQTWDQSAYEFANKLNEQSRKLGANPKNKLNPTDQATLRINGTDSYKATMYFSDGWNLQKVESSSDSSSFKISNDQRVKQFFKVALQSALK